MIWSEGIKQKLAPIWHWFTLFKQTAKTQTQGEPEAKRKDRNHTVQEPVTSGTPARVNATAWDRFIDGFNRLPRPLLTVAILGFFLVAPLYPDAFLKVAAAYAKMPHGFWALLSVVVGFYFTGRMQSKGHALRIHEMLEAGLEKPGDDRFDDPDVPPMEVHYQAALVDGVRKKPNNAIDRWKKNRRKQ